MAPAEPLKLASFAVNHITESGRVADPGQRISVLDALRGVTIEAAYSWRKENDLGTIAPGKLATFTVLADDPFEVEPSTLGGIPVVGVVYEGRWSPVRGSGAAHTAAALSAALPGHGRVLDGDAHDHEVHGCSCKVARLLSAAYSELRALDTGDRSAA